MEVRECDRCHFQAPPSATTDWGTAIIRKKYSDKDISLEICTQCYNAVKRYSTTASPQEG